VNAAVASIDLTAARRANQSGAHCKWAEVEAVGRIAKDPDRDSGERPVDQVSLPERVWHWLGACCAAVDNSRADPPTTPALEQLD